MTVGKKISSLPALALSGILLISAVFIHGIDSVYDAASYGTVNTVPSLMMLDRLDAAVSDSRVKIWKYLSARDAAMAGAAEQALSKARDAFDSALQDYEPLVSDAKDKALLAADRADSVAYYHLTDEALALSRAGKHSEAVDLMVAQVQSIQKLLSDLETHRAYNETLGKQGADEAVKARSRARWIGVLIALATTAALSLLSVLVVRGLTRQLGGEPAAVVTVAGKVATGDFSSLIDLRPGDDSSLFAMIAKMQSDLQLRLAAAQREAAENARIRTALDRVSAGVSSCPASNRIASSEPRSICFIAMPPTSAACSRISRATTAWQSSWAP
jgi:methyl-accepting chemotaxis protein